MMQRSCRFRGPARLSPGLVAALILAAMATALPARAGVFDREYDSAARDHDEDRRAALATYVGRRAFGLPFIGYFGCTGGACDLGDDPASRSSGQGSSEEESGSLGEDNQ